MLPWQQWSSTQYLIACKICGIFWKGVLESLTHVFTDLKISKESNFLIQVIEMWSGSTISSESFSARRLRKQLQSAHIPPLVPKNEGVKDPISTSSTVCWFFRFFSSCCSLKIVDVAFPWLHSELTCVTLTSKNAVTPRDQNPCLQSSLASELYYGSTNVWIPRVKNKSFGWAANRNQPQHRLKFVVTITQ